MNLRILQGVRRLRLSAAAIYVNITVKIPVCRAEQLLASLESFSSQRGFHGAYDSGTDFHASGFPAATSTALGYLRGCRPMCAAHSQDASTLSSASYGSVLRNIANARRAVCGLPSV